MKRTALRRKGKGFASREYMRRLHTSVVMLRVGAALFPSGARGRSWRGACAWCGEVRWLVCSHILAVGKVPSMRYDPDNAFALCSPCHLFRWHREPDKAVAFARMMRGDDVFEALRLRADENKRQGVTRSSYMLLLMDEWQQRTGKPYVDAI